MDVHSRAGLPAVLAAGLLLAGCAGPRSVAGTPEPLGPAAATATAAATPSRPAPVTAVSGTAVLPAAYVPYRLGGQGVTIQVPVPASWSMTRTTYGADFGDPTGRLLLRLEIRTRTAQDAVKGWQEYEPELSGRLANYRRVDLVAVPGVGDSAADLTFTFERAGGRKVVDRSVLVGQASIAVYFSAELALYDPMLPVFTKAAQGLRISGG